MPPTECSEESRWEAWVERLQVHIAKQLPEPQVPPPSLGTYLHPFATDLSCCPKATYQVYLTDMP